MSNALATNDIETAQTYVLNFIKTFDGITASETNDLGQSIVKDAKNELVKHTNAFNNAKDITSARVPFVDLSKTLITLVEAFGTNRSAVHVMHDATAFNNSGASWLSFNANVKNPYTGNQTGELRETFTTKK